MAGSSMASFGQRTPPFYRGQGLGGDGKGNVDKAQPLEAPGLVVKAAPPGFRPFDNQNAERSA